MPPSVSVIVPMFNEAGTILEILGKLVDHPLVTEVIVVDDGSQDASAELVAAMISPRIKLVRHAVNQGKGRAIRTGLEQITGDVVIIQDADLEYSPADFEPLLLPLTEGRADVVFGSRYLQADGTRKGHGRLLDYGVWLLNWMTWWLYRLQLTDEATCYKVFRTSDLRLMNLECERFEFCPEATAKAARMKLRFIEVPISYHPRGIAEGKKLRISDGWLAITTLWRYRHWLPQQ